MSTVVFIGPTLSREDLGLQAAIRGPARCGDVLRAVGEGFRTIAIVDGYFDQCLPVWHKEILWAMSRGCIVYGASSMGALRAAELGPYGMRGVGRIFEAYRDGLLEDDDEVALVHGDETTRYRPGSEALVNMRVTLQRALAGKVLDRRSAEGYVELAKARFYPERNYHQLFEDALGVHELKGTVAALRMWLGPRFEQRVDQKADDARLLLRHLADPQRPAPPAADPAWPAFAFAYTEAFRELVRRNST